MILDEIDRVPAVSFFKRLGFAWRRIPWLEEVFAWSQKRRRLHDVLGSGFVYRGAVSRVSVGAIDHRPLRRAFPEPGVGLRDRLRPQLATAALRVGEFEYAEIDPGDIRSRRKADRRI